MATAVKIRVRRDTTANWASSNPVLALGEIAADMDLHRMKVGNGTSTWSSLPWFDSDIINNFTSTRTDASLSAAKGKELYDKITSVENAVASGGTEIIDNTGSARTDAALSANQGRELNNKITSVTSMVDNFGTFGMSYNITEFNAYSKPTKIEFADGITATLLWQGGTQLKTITGSNGEKIEILYDENGRVVGRKVTKAS